MANDINAVTSLAQQSIAGLIEMCPLLGLLPHNYGTDASGIGQTILVPVFGANSVTETTVKGGTVDYTTNAAGALTSIPVQLSALLYSAHKFSGYEMENTTTETQAQALVEGVKAIASGIDKKVATLALTSGNYTEHTCSSSTAFTADDLSAARGVAVAAKLDPNKLIVVLNPVALNNLLSDSKVTASLTPLAQDALKSGKIVELYGVKVVSSGNVASTHWGYLMSSDAIAVAVRPTAPLGAEWSQTVTIEGAFSATTKGVSNGNSNSMTFVSEAAVGVAAVKSGTEKRIIALKKAA